MLEEINLSNDKKIIVGFRVQTLHMIEDDQHIFISPSLSISGYGKNKAEAEKSHKINLNLFIDDYNSSPDIAEKTNFLIQQGWDISNKKQKIEKAPKDSSYLTHSIPSLYTYA